MNLTDVIEELPLTSWNGPFVRDVQERAASALESGRVLFLPHLPFEIQPAERRFLLPGSAGHERKNISLEPTTGRLSNATLPADDATALAAMIERFGRAATALITGLIPVYTNHLERARTSFRPVEIAGRQSSVRHDDKLLHVDAFPSRPLRDRRILRLFSNIAPDGTPRAWNLGEPFEAFARAFLPRTGRPVPGSPWLLERLGITKGRRSPYDHVMLRLHDLGKQDSTYQSSPRKVPISFPAGSTWICYTDQVLHAALSGHCAIEQTFHLPVDAMADPAKAPLRVLERLTGRALA
jgi:3-deoxy-D-manno-oct-2-ulosonic acid (Kdo) hydroxylase